MPPTSWVRPEPTSAPLRHDGLPRHAAAKLGLISGLSALQLGNRCAKARRADPNFFRAHVNVQAIDLFCGAGGLSLGLQRSGIDVVAGIDNDPECRFPYSENIRAPFIEEDINKLSGATLNSYYSSGSVRVLAGCAPCQPFSGYAAAHGIAGDKRVDLLMRLISIVHDVSPDIITIENVARLSHRPIWAEFVQGLVDAGYHTDWSVIDAAGFGVPQHRRRLVLLASRRGKITIPSPEAFEPTTVRKTLGHLPRLEAGEASSHDTLHTSRVLTDINLKRIRLSKPSGTWRDWPEELRASCHRKAGGKTFPSVYGRMEWDEPAPTITTQFYGFGNGRFGHPEQDRALTLREGALLQTFPQEFRFHNQKSKPNFRSIGRLIGNAVPPTLGEAIGNAIVSHVAEFSARPQATPMR